MCNSAQLLTERLNVALVKEKKIKSETVYISNFNQNVVKEEDLTYHKYSSSVYDATGNITQFTSYTDKSKSYLSENKYDPLGNLLECIYRDNFDSVMSRTVYKYDNSGNLTEKVKYNKRGTIIFKFTISEHTKGKNKDVSYDKKGRMVEENVAIEDCDHLMRHTYEYNENGLISIEKIFSPKNGIFDSSIPCYAEASFHGGKIIKYQAGNYICYYI